MTLNDLGDKCLNIAKKRGFYDEMRGYFNHQADLLAEVKEAEEAYCKGNINELGLEWIDQIFVLLSQGRKMGFDLDKLAEIKLKFNELRKDRAKI